MTWSKLKELSLPHNYAWSIDRFFPRSIRKVLRKSFALLAVASFFFSFSVLPLDLSSADGLFFLFAFFYLALSFLEFFYNSMKFTGLYSRFFDKSLDSEEKIEYALSLLISESDEIDLSKALSSKIGLELFQRCGLTREETFYFLTSGRMPVVASSLNLGSEAEFSAYIASLYEADQSLQLFLNAKSIGKDEFLGAAAWLASIYEKEHRIERFWSRENLGAIPSIATSWNYGIATDLGKYGIPLNRTGDISILDIENGFRNREVTLLESILEKIEAGNALIIEEDESIARDIVLRLLKKIKLGISQPSLENKLIIELDWNALIGNFKEKAELELEIIKIMNGAVKAGNIIVFIKDISGFITSLKPLGINLTSLLSDYLFSSRVQIIAQTSNADFHFFIETNASLLESFERVIPDTLGAPASIPAIMEKALVLEKQYNLIFSFPAVKALSESAERYITYGEMPDKALNLMEEICSFVLKRGSRLVREGDVTSFISEKTGIQSGDIKEQEADKIMHLEEILHLRLIGQDEAVKAISGAMRRARTGMVGANRPIASFLFVGPTGVGKTETSKALAESFFGDEDKMIRFDMSEYNGPDAMIRLLGSFVDNKNGLLASEIRDHPYGVLLLDEFEKASPEVHDLFLQILDEGLFTDALGKQVNCRNLIIIATSNAGSNYIWNALEQGKDINNEKDNIIDAIIGEQAFRPELINRFDGVILFHPLQSGELKSIARLELQKLQERLKNQNYDFVITEPLLNFLVEKGTDPKFGARSINRLIKTYIEDFVAKKILSGAVGPGDKIELDISDLSKNGLN